ncbi:MAG: hypothetical protein U0892_04010 [Pirellulales bacterium]
MSAGLSKQSYIDLLRPFQRRCVMLVWTKTWLVASAVILLSLFAVMWLDLIWALPSSVRWFVTRIGVLLGMVAACAAAVRLAQRFTWNRLAERIDQVERTGGEILSGLNLVSQDFYPQGEMARGMAELAAERAGRRVASVLPQSIAPASELKKSLWFTAVSAATILIVSVIVPSIAWVQLQRFLFPASDIPPFTGVVMSLELERDSVLYGQDVSAAVSVELGKVGRVALVTRDADGTEHSIPMLQADGNRWQAMLTRVTAPMAVYARSGASRTKMKQLDVIFTPKILPPKVRIIPPEYTHRAPYEGLLPEAGLSGLKGTVVEWRVTSNRPLASGVIEVVSKSGSTQVVPLEPVGEGEDANTVAGSFTLTSPGRFELKVIDTEGLESQDRIEGAIHILQDERPVVRILEPKPLSLATPDIKLPVVVNAEDDYGITSVSLFRSVNGTPARAVNAEVDGGPRQAPTWELPLSEYGLEPGDEIHLYARTEDNDPAGAKGAESPVTVVRIISKQEFQEMMVRQRGAESIAAKYQAANRYMEKLAEALREANEAAEKAAADPRNAELQAEAQKKMQAAEQAAAEAAEEIRKLSEQPLPVDVDKELVKELAEMSNMAAQMQQQLSEMNKPDSPAGPSDPSEPDSNNKNGEQQSKSGAPGQGSKTLSEQERKQLKKMIEQIRKEREELQEQAIEPLQSMQQILPLMADQQLFTELAARQRDLSERMQSLKNADDSQPNTQRRIAELESEQEELKQQLDSLLSDIESHAAEISADDPELGQLKETAENFAKAVRASSAQGDMSSAQKDLLGSKYPEAQSSAEKAAATLESFLSQCNGMGEQGNSACKAKFNPGKGCPNPGNSLQQMLQMMGMKPGSSSGKQAGKSQGTGAGGGYSIRSPGPQNVGMYGSIPNPQSTSGRGRSDKQAQGGATSGVGAPNKDGGNQGVEQTRGDAGGAADQSIPGRYRSQVADYFRALSEDLGSDVGQIGQTGDRK